LVFRLNYPIELTNYSNLQKVTKLKERFMTKKFEARFASATLIPPSCVYVSPSDFYLGKFSVGILYAASSSGTFQSASGISKVFDLKQNLVDSEEVAKIWATEWLSNKFECEASLTEVSTK